MAAAAADPAALAAWTRAPERLTLEELTAWGEALGAGVPLPVLITLDGPLGAGKTTLARAICAGAGVHDRSAVTSPTFAIAHEYAAARAPIAHLDLYRLRDADAVEAMGFDGVLERTALQLVEWSDRAAGLLPVPHLAIRLDYPTDAADLDGRLVACEVVGA